MQLNQINSNAELEEKLFGIFFSIVQNGKIIAQIWLIKRQIDGAIFLSSLGDDRKHEIETEAKH